MQAPTIHLNGTSRESLLYDLSGASDALRIAIEELAETAPNARDYYVQSDPEAYRKARTEHEARMAKLQEVRADLEAIMLAIGEQ